jgi:hypothetical protein
MAGVRYRISMVFNSPVKREDKRVCKFFIVRHLFLEGSLKLLQ